MMKRWMSFLLLASLMLLTACGGGQNADTGGSGTQNGSGAAASQDGGSAAPQDGGAEQEDAGKGYIFQYQDVSVEIDREAAAIIEALGEPSSYYEAASCAFEGLDKMYTYGSFEIDTYPMEEVDYISAVILKDDLVSTAEGVAIGDSLEKVTETYGEGVEELGMLVYEKDGMKLCFILQDGAVASIEYRTTVLD